MVHNTVQDKLDFGGFVWPHVRILSVGCEADFTRLSKAFPAVRDLSLTHFVASCFTEDRDNTWANLVDQQAFRIVPLACHARRLSLYKRQFRVYPYTAHCIELCSPIVVSCGMDVELQDCFRMIYYPL
ncbi:hypothetical protein SCP_0509070 [Sparassis crispa]|uniref:Uncharacterized protein n=1 Tax=Sparassis crispa TaxID=139825 RepID=A0A401GNV2_9APHY|nr:hypothetical protein SCP_0509070 [Sparassis crispa]GBE83850.1 hypothetical protein SCP_0509070 [Sparassis crispa]